MVIYVDEEQTENYYDKTGICYERLLFPFTNDIYFSTTVISPEGKSDYTESDCMRIVF